MTYVERSRKAAAPYLFFSKLIVITVTMILLFLLVVFVLPKRTAAAGDNASSYCITSVQIQAGDTLWSLAKEYYSDEFSSITNYIEEIKRMNGLSSDKLYAGNYILIPQYAAN